MEPSSNNSSPLFLMRTSLSLLTVITIVSATMQSATAADVKFRFPLTGTPKYASMYDHDTSSPAVKNYKCGTSNVYDKHQGTDFLADVGIIIYAGAKGGLYYRYDSCNTYGSWTSTCGNGFGNHAKIDHEGSMTDGNGWTSIYAHMKQGTVVGLASVYCGSKIGQVGSSGKSSAPHLHFEVRKYTYPNNDPFSGSCSGSKSFWVNQNNGNPTTACQS